MKKSGRFLSEKFIKRAVAVALLVVLVGVVFGGSIKSEALFDASKAITYEEFASKVTVEDSVLFIGTYIIHKDALNDQLYEKAKASASESAQNDVYYKSEISDGQWFSIGDVENGVKGISTEGRPENVETLNPLYVTYYVGADGIMKDAKTMAAVNPFDVPDPYNLSGLPELEPIWSQYTMSDSKENISQETYLKNKNSNDSGNLRTDVYYYQLLSTFFSLNLRDAQTDKCDEQLKGLNDTYIAMKAAGQEEEAKLVYELMEKVDAKRRALIMERLAELDENLLNTLYTLSSGEYYTPYGNFKDASSDESGTSSPGYSTKLKNSLQHDFTGSNSASDFIKSWMNILNVTSDGDGWWTVLDTYQEDKKKRSEEANSENDDYVFDQTPTEFPFAVDNNLLEAIGTAMGNCSDSYTTYLGKALVDSDDILGHVIYDYSTQVIDASTSGSLGGPVTYLKHATNIRDNIISDKEGELALLKSSLISMASGKYQSKATSGVDSTYAGLNSEGAKKSALEQQKAEEESDRSMLQFLIEALRQRDEAPNALEFVNGRITWTEDLLTTIPGDDFKSYSSSSVNAHLVWLKEEAQKIIDSDESLRSKLDELLDKKEELQKKRDACLDNNDLAGAAAYDAKIKAVDQDIDAEGGDQGNMTDKLVDKALAKLADDSDADLSGIAEALAEVGATDELNALAKKAAESGASAASMAGIKDAGGDAGAGGDGSGGSGSGDGSGGSGSGDGSGGSGSGSGSGDGSGGKAVSADDLLAMLEALLGKSLDEMDDGELAVVGATASRLSKSGLDPATDLTKKVVNKLIDTNNKYTYRQYDGNKALEYISMETLSDVTSYRYFYDDTKATATMTKGANIYIFKRGSDEMHKQSPETDPESMNEKIQYNGIVYIDEDDAQNYFKCIAEYCNTTDYAVCLPATKEAAVKEYTKQLQEALQ